METFLIVLGGTVLSAFTEWSKRLKVSQKSLLIYTTIFIAFFYVVFKEYNPWLLEKGIQMGLSVLGVANMIYMTIQKYQNNK